MQSDCSLSSHIFANPRHCDFSYFRLLQLTAPHAHGMVRPLLEDFDVLCSAAKIHGRFLRRDSMLVGWADLDLASTLRWRLVGPYRGGRVMAVAGHPVDWMVF